jgi:deoxyribodipyrimidine photo-lyase
MMNSSKSLVWFRRDLRAFDHAALHHALRSSQQVYCVFVYDTDILDELPKDDRRLRFIHASLAQLDAELRRLGGYLIVRHGSARDEVAALAEELGIDAVHAGSDYEPSAIARDLRVAEKLAARDCAFHTYKDQVIFEKQEVLTLAGGVFSVFTPYKNAWLKRLAAHPETLATYPVDAHAHTFARPTGAPAALPALEDIGFTSGEPPLPAGMDGAEALFETFVSEMADYGRARDFPAEEGTSRLSAHLRFGTTSIRHLVRSARDMVQSGAGGTGASVWLSELIWRDFYAMVLSQNPHVVERSFKPAYDAVEWDTGDEADALFAAWCEGRTGYPLVDAAMLQLNQTGFMHNRLRMVTASFLTKDLGVDWRRGERYFARQLNDYELASNNDTVRRARRVHPALPAATGKARRQADSRAVAGEAGCAGRARSRAGKGLSGAGRGARRSEKTHAGTLRGSEKSGGGGGRGEGRRERRLKPSLRHHAASRPSKPSIAASSTVSWYGLPK